MKDTDVWKLVVVPMLLNIRDHIRNHFTFSSTIILKVSLAVVESDCCYFKKKKKKKKKEDLWRNGKSGSIEDMGSISESFFSQNLFGFELIEKLLRVIISPPSYNIFFLDFNHL
jgi:hypothetical protein